MLASRKMAVDTLLNRYQLSARAEGLSPKTVAHVKRVMGFFDTFLGGISDVREVEPDDLRRFIVAMQQKTKWAGQPQSNSQKLSSTSINTYVRGIKSFWSWLKREGIIKHNPLASVPAPRVAKKLPRVISEEELRWCFGAVSDNSRNMAMLQLFLDTGITVQEIVDLIPNDADLQAGTVKVLREKTRKERMVYISPQTILAIDTYCRFHRPEPVGQNRLFLTEDGRPLSRARVQKILERIGRKAGIRERLSPHKLRHTYASLALKNGANLEYLRRSLGHSDVKTTEIYLSVADTDVAQAHKVFSPVANLGVLSISPREKQLYPKIYADPRRPTPQMLSPQELKSLLLGSPNPPGRILEVDYDRTSHVLVETETVIEPGQTVEHKKTRII